ncbi:HU family DNA-binding protein [Mycoplasma putrefaciens]|uniref:DNA-binding HU domain protein n=1 Tax=Mycoplasma putrefaciens (strain ATCC 15718 / NCTC 10155 / C30 KS-1 / KS-1) TaxID=743965 RepID=A0A7U4E9K6_MYCPK|nr:HU family DNA-binding protein [Mycoplasma putrefaciens]AEM69034.1 DNA-binding HU domain protein [Mycoplasma putrefaciens KS1]
MKKEREMAKPLSLFVARMFLVFFFISLIATIVLKFANVWSSSTNGGGKPDPKFLWSLNNFSLMFNGTFVWGTSDLDMFLNILLVTLVPLCLFFSLLAYIHYYKHQPAVEHKKSASKKMAKNSSSEMKHKDPVKQEKKATIIQTPVSENIIIIPSDSMITNKVHEEKPKPKTVKKENVKAAEPIKMVAEEPFEDILELVSVKKVRKPAKKYPQVTKAALLESLYSSEELKSMTKVDVKEVFENAFTVLKKHLENGEEILIPKFGKFEVVEREARESFNPQTREKINIPAHRVVKFQVAKSVKEKMNPNR